VRHNQARGARGGKGIVAAQLRAIAAGHGPNGARGHLRLFGLSRKGTVPVHTGRAGPDGGREWQVTAVPGPLRLGGEGHVVLAQAGPAFADGAGRGAKHWSPVGEKIPVPHTGRREGFAAFGALADGGRRPFRTRGRSGSATPVRPPRGLWPQARLDKNAA